MTIAMREKQVCRHCLSSSQRSSAIVGGGRRPFAIPGSRPHYAPDLPFKLEHILIDVAIDPKAKTVKGKTVQRIRTVAPDQTTITMDQVGLQIESAKISGKSAKHDIEGNKLKIELPQAPKPGETLEVEVTYFAHNPRRGLYFTGPDEAYPQKPYQVWSQGQDEDNRFWFPTFDYPNQKATSEVIATVPAGFTAVSNGALLKHEGNRFHYKLGTPHVTYLITLTVAEFSAWEDKGPHGLPVQYFVAPGKEDDGKRAFSNTPKMIEIYEKRTGVRYPYEKYSQVAVQDFIFGGMENTSATTQTDSTLHDERAHLDFSSDPLVSHELAHQWFGDLLTCRDWSHGWLNEGFATFMERVWIEEHTGKDGGWDEAKYYSYMDLKEYLADDGGKYRRPIVCNTYQEPIDLFDTHLYQKGGLVLNLIRGVLGKDLFWKSINAYVERHKGQNVETLDLIRAIEDTTGRNLRQLFDEWLFKAGHPEFELSYNWHDDQKMAEIVIEQKQTQGKPELEVEGAITPLFHLPVTLELTLTDGSKVTRRVQLGEARERVFLAAPSKPKLVRFDPDHWIPKTLKFPRPKEMLLTQLKEDKDIMGRIEAVKELSKIADREVIEALGKAAASDAFWGVQAEAASALAEIRSDASRDQLIAALSAQHPKARRAVVNALGSYADDKASDALKKLAQKDPSYYVEADATLAWAKSRSLRSPEPKAADIDATEQFLISQLEKPSYREVIRAAALKGLATLPGIGRGERSKAIQALLEWGKQGKPLDARVAAVTALGELAKTAIPSERARVLGAMDLLADEENFRLRGALVHALEATEAPHAIEVLEKLRRIELDGRIRRNAQTAIDTLRTAGTAPESVVQLKAALEKLEEEYRKLRGSMEELQAKGSKLSVS